MDSKSAIGARPARVRRLLLAGALLLVSVGLAWGLTDALAGGPSPSPVDDEVVLRVGWIMDPDSLNPFVGANFTSYLLRSLNYDVLVGFDAATLKPTRGDDATGLATDWTTSADGKTWTFELRHDAEWQDGHGPVTASDVTFTYDYVIENEMAAFMTYTQGVKRVEAIGDYTVRIDCDRPKADMMDAASVLPILPEHVWSKISPEKAANTYGNDPPVVGSGPFQCVEFERSGFVRMVANKEYWRAVPRVDEILFEFYTNRDTMAWDLEAGSLDACYQLAYQEVQRLQGTSGVTARAFVVNGYDDLVINSYNPPPGGKSLGNPVLRDWRFRQALQWAVDREKLAEIVYHGIGLPGDTVIAPGFSTDPEWHWAPPEGDAYTFDLDKAGDLLDEAGYRDTDGDGVRDYRGEPIKLRLWAMTEYATSRQESKMIAGWFRDLGLEIDFRAMPMGAMYDGIFNTVDGELVPDFDICQSGWYLGLDPGFSLSFFTTDQIGGWSDSAFSDAEFDQLFTQQARALDAAERKRLVDRMQQIVYEQSPYIVLAYFADTEAWRDEWAGWVSSPAPDGTAVLTTDSYLYVQPQPAEGADDEGVSTVAIALVLGGVVGAVAVTGIVVRRRRPREVEE